MKIVRYRQHETVGYGVLEGGTVQPLAGEFPHLRPLPDAGPVALASVKLLAPARPGKIIAVGPNYKAHLVGRPLPERPFLWIKPSSAVINPDDDIVLPAMLQGVTNVNHESELAMVIGKRARNVPRERALEHVYGFTCINDVTAGDLGDRAAFRSSAIFVDGKIFDTFAPMGPLIETSFDPADVRIRCRVNGTTRQDHRTSDMIWPCDELLALISRVLTLEPGDVIATGSPPGVDALHAGDRVEVEVDGIGVLRSGVIAARVR